MNSKTIRSKQSHSTNCAMKYISLSKYSNSHKSDLTSKSGIFKGLASYLFGSIINLSSGRAHCAFLISMKTQMNKLVTQNIDGDCGHGAIKYLHLEINPQKRHGKGSNRKHSRMFISRIYLPQALFCYSSKLATKIYFQN